MLYPIRDIATLSHEQRDPLKGFSLRWADLSLKGTVNNLFDEEYLSVYPVRCRELTSSSFIGITPKWGQEEK